MSSTQLTFEEQLAIDMEVHRIAHATHYELLGLFQGADRTSVLRAYRERCERLTPEAYGGRNLGDYLSRLERVREALTLARDTLSDPERRARYDESIEGQKRASVPPSFEDSWDFDEVKPNASPSGLSTLSVPPAAPSQTPPSSPVAPAPAGTMTVGRVHLVQVAAARPLPADDAPPTVPAPPTSVPPPAASQPTRPTRPLGAAPAPLNAAPQPRASVMNDARTALGPTPPPLARPPMRPAAAPAPQPATPPASTPPAPPLTAPLAFGVHGQRPQVDLREWVSRDDFNVLQSEMGSVLQEMNTLCRAVEYCLGLAEPGESPRRAAVAQTRGAIAALRARRAEREEEWAAALENWERAILANPSEARYHAHLADVILRMDGDLDMAESHARRAVELNPDMAYAQSTLAVVLSRRDF